ncbi:MAG: hypothetical protein Q7R34_00120, partial [Dehalococcoidia bacterium]|nr:hypothetical protein [Dehalococcoidia bacterium]
STTGEVVSLPLTYRPKYTEAKPLYQKIFKRLPRPSLRSVLAMTLAFSLILNSLFMIPASVYATSGTWSQTNWAGGNGQTAWSDTTKFSSSSNVTTGTANQVTLTNTEKLTNGGFSTDDSAHPSVVTGWSVGTVNIPSGWVEVPGNSTFSTTNFLAMKYEAKCAATSDLTTGLTSSDTGYNTWPNNTAACTSANSRAVVSVASGYPIANISQTNSITYCSGVTVGSTSAHLQTNNEWMTIARDAEAQAGNWSLGSVGSGYLFAGHNDNAPAKARVASTTDTGNYRCAYTDTAGTTENPTSCPTNTANNTSGTAGNQVRTFTLSNGTVIWDIPGNVWEWTNNIQSSAIDTTAGWVEWNHANVAAGALALYGPPSGYLSAQGMGKIYGGALNNAFLRGGYWAY